MPGTGYRNLYEESVSAITATPSVELGERRQEGSKQYVYVYNTGTTAAVGYGLIQSINSGFSVTVSAALKDRCFAVVQNTALKEGYYGWAMTKGTGKVEIGADHATAQTGDGIYLVANGAFGMVQTGATGSTYAAMEAGYMLESVVDGASGSAQFDCRG